MPGPVGHMLGGVAAAWAIDLFPGDRAWRTGPPSASWLVGAGGGVTIACAVIGALPDADLLIHAHRTFAHSVTAVAVAGIVGFLAGRRTRRPAARLALMFAAAYATHLLLDWLAVDPSAPRGLQILWPFSHRWFISDLDWFPPTERREIFSVAAFTINLKAVTEEILFLGPIVAALWLVRVKALARFSTELARRDHAPQ